ncbi:MAG: hypothetical protein AAF737_09500 [Pseudomonadota bacterium]
MKSLKFAAAGSVALMILGGAATLASASTACLVTADGLNCPGETRAEVMQSLAADGTGEAFSKPEAFTATLGAKPAAREAFRRDLEQVRRTVERQQRSDRRAERRGTIDAAEFAKREAMYQRAMVNYREGYWFYQNLIWRTAD